MHVYELSENFPFFECVISYTFQNYKMRLSFFFSSNFEIKSAKHVTAISNFKIWKIWAIRL
jgi:hypothetical protein